MSFFEMTDAERESGIAFADDQSAINALFAEACIFVGTALAEGLPEDTDMLIASLIQVTEGHYALAAPTTDAPSPEIQLIALAIEARCHADHLRPVAMLQIAQAWLLIGSAAEQRTAADGPISDHPDRRDAVVITVSVPPDSPNRPRARNYLVTLTDGIGHLAADHFAYQAKQADDEHSVLCLSGRLPQLYLKRP